MRATGVYCQPMSAESPRVGRATRVATENVLHTTRTQVATASAAPLTAHRALAFVASLVVAVGLAVGVASPASAATSTYVALGDSYAAGQGAGSYTNTSCHVSRKSYPARLDADASIQLVAQAACSGSSTAEVISQQIPKVPTTATHVTLTVGGNDVGFTNVMQWCFILVSTSRCTKAIAAGDAMVDNGTVAARVAATVDAIQARAPGAKVIVTGYPKLFAPTVTRRFAQQVNASTADLNAAIRAGVASAGGVFVDMEAVFATHGIGSSSSWINDWRWLNASAAFHPNASGYTAYANKIKASW